MSEQKVTLRIERTANQVQNIGRAYSVKFSFGNLWFPKSFTEITEHEKFIDIDCPLWFAKKNGLGDFIVAEY